MAIICVAIGKIMAREPGLDLLKVICAAMVVLLHVDWVLHDLFVPLTRCAVPCFFMISGYLMADEGKLRPEKLTRAIKKIFVIILWSSIIFAVYQEISCLLTYGSLYLPGKWQWIRFVLFNEHPFGFHLWYLSAYLYVLLICLAAGKFIQLRRLFFLIPLLLLCDLVLGKYSNILIGKEFDFIICRNFLFVGLPYFLLGVWLKKNNNKAKSLSSNVLWGG